MTTQPTTALTDTFVRCVETNNIDGLAALYTDEALFDAHVPNWRFQVQGREAIVEQLRSWFPAPGRFTSWQEEETGAGDVLVRFELREREGTDGEIRIREMQLWRLDGERIDTQVVFCAGRWDVALVRQMAEQAPLIRP